MQIKKHFLKALSLDSQFSKAHYQLALIDNIDGDIKSAESHLIRSIELDLIKINGFEKKALNILKKKKNLRIIDSSNLDLKDIENISSNFNSILLQTSDTKKFTTKDFKVVSKLKPNFKTLKNLIFAFNICRFVKSNAIVLVKENSTVGIGSGQPSRLDSCKIAINKMQS